MRRREFASSVQIGGRSRAFAGHQEALSESAGCKVDPFVSRAI